MDLSQVTLAQMRYAVAIQDSGSFRQAGERCLISQPGLSMQVQKLEELLGIRLFDRSKKPVLVTDAGAIALDQMRVVLKETERLGQMTAEHGEVSGAYRLGVIPSLAPTLIPLFLKTFLERHPALDVTVEELRTEDLVARLRADSLDGGLAATPLDLPGLRERPLGHEPFLVYLPPGDPLLRKSSLRDADLANHELWIMPEGHCFRTQVLSFCERASMRRQPRVHFESGSFETLMRLVDGGLGATILPALVVELLSARKREAQVRPLHAPTPAREIGLVTARTDLRRRANDTLAELVTTVLARRLGRPSRRIEVLHPLGG